MEQKKQNTLLRQMTPNWKTTAVIVLLIYTWFTLSPRCPLSTIKLESVETTEGIKENKEIYDDKEGREQSAWIDSAVKGGKHQIW